MKPNKNREITFDLIRKIYKEEVETYDLSLDKLPNYTDAFLRIATLIEHMKLSDKVVKLVFGEKFCNWFYRGHEKVMKNIWGNQDV